VSVAPGLWTGFRTWLILQVEAIQQPVLAQVCRRKDDRSTQERHAGDQACNSTSIANAGRFASRSLLPPAQNKRLRLKQIENFAHCNIKVLRWPTNTLAGIAHPWH
jgi:hypothetical protein